MLSLGIYQNTLFKKLAIIVSDLPKLLKVLSDRNRLRILLLCRDNELSVSEIVEALNLSQPLVSKHLKIILSYNLVSVIEEGAFRYYKLNVFCEFFNLVKLSIESFVASDGSLNEDIARLDELRKVQSQECEKYFNSIAKDWEQTKSVLYPVDRVEKIILEIFESFDVGALLDVGTGTGRMLDLLKDEYHCALGIDNSREMLKLARNQLAINSNTKANVRYCDMYSIPYDEPTFDAVLFHLSLNYVRHPQKALQEGLRVLNPGGRVVIVDFLKMEGGDFSDFDSKRRAGLSEAEVIGWLKHSNFHIVNKNVVPAREAKLQILEAETPKLL